MTTHQSLFPDLVPDLVELRIGPTLYRVARDGSRADGWVPGRSKKQPGEWVPMRKERAEWLATLLPEEG